MCPWDSKGEALPERTDALQIPITTELEVVHVTPAVPLIDPDDPRWYAVRTRSRFEAVTAAALRDKGFPEFLPMWRSCRQWSDRVKELDLPLFPGYVFCRFNARDPYPVLNSPGVVHIVSAGTRFVPVEDREIESIRSICAAGVPAYPWDNVIAGQRLMIVRGPLKGVEGTLISVRDQYRLVVSISLLQRSVSTELQRDWITTAC
jgi:transcriptional antiterminator NusG